MIADEKLFIYLLPRVEFTAGVFIFFFIKKKAQIIISLSTYTFDTEKKIDFYPTVVV